MLIVALALAVIGLAALVFAVVTSNELVAWVCIAASVIGVVLLIIDALQERRRRQAGATPAEDVAKPQTGEATAHDDQVSTASDAGTQEIRYADYPEDAGDDGYHHVSDAGEQVPAGSTDAEPDDEESGA